MMFSRSLRAKNVKTFKILYIYDNYLYGFVTLSRRISAGVKKLVL